MLKGFNICLCVTVGILVLLYPDMSVEAYLVTLISLLASGIVTHIAMTRFRDPVRSDIGLLLLFIVVFYWIAYISKLPTIIYFPESFWVTRKLISYTELRQDAPQGFLIATLGYLGLVLSIVWSRSNFRINKRLVRMNTSMSYLLILCVILLVLKYLLKAKLNIGVPGLVPAYLGVPMLTGVSSLLIGTGCLLVVNVNLFMAILVGKKNIVIVSLLFVVINLFIDLVFGAKMTLVYEVVILIYYYYVLNRYCSLESRRSVIASSKMIVFVLGFLVFFILIFYKYINFYRFARLESGSSGADMTAAVQLALHNNAVVGYSSFVEMYNRISGLEVLTSVIGLKDLLVSSFSLIQMVDGSLVHRFTYVVIGSEDANTAFGVTQFGYLYVVGGYIGLVLGVIVLGLFIVWAQKILIGLTGSFELKVAILPVWCILVLKLLLGPGDLLLWGKEILLFAVVLRFVTWISDSEKAEVAG